MVYGKGRELIKYLTGLYNDVSGVLRAHKVHQ